MLPGVATGEALLAGAIAGYVMALFGYWMEGFFGLPRMDMSQAGMKYLGRAQPDNMTWLVGIAAHHIDAAILGLLYAAAFYKVIVDIGGFDPNWWRGILLGLGYGAGVMIFLPGIILGTLTRFQMPMTPRDLIASLAVHLVYGAVLGAIYFPFGGFV